MNFRFWLGYGDVNRRETERNHFSLDSCKSVSDETSIDRFMVDQFFLQIAPDHLDQLLDHRTGSIHRFGQLTFVQANSSTIFYNIATQWRLLEIVRLYHLVVLSYVTSIDPVKDQVMIYSSDETFAIHFLYRLFTLLTGFLPFRIPEQLLIYLWAHFLRPPVICLTAFSGFSDNRPFPELPDPRTAWASSPTHVQVIESKYEHSPFSTEEILRYFKN